MFLIVRLDDHVSLVTAVGRCHLLEWRLSQGLKRNQDIRLPLLLLLLTSSCNCNVARSVTIAGSGTEESLENTKLAPDVPGVSRDQLGYATSQTEPDKVREQEKTALEHQEKHVEQDAASTMMDYSKKGNAEVFTSNQQSTLVDIMKQEGAEKTEETIVLQTTGQNFGGDTGHQHGSELEKLDHMFENLQTKNLQDVSQSLVPNMSSNPVVLKGTSVPGQTRDEKR